MIYLVEEVMFYCYFYNRRVWFIQYCFGLFSPVLLSYQSQVLFKTHDLVYKILCGKRKVGD